MCFYEIEKCEAAKNVFRGEWRWGLNCYVFNKVANDSNLVAARHELTASIYYTFSKVKYEMGSVEFRMSLRTLNNKNNVTVKPNNTTYSNDCHQLECFNRFVKMVYPSKRIVFCCMFITYSNDWLWVEEYPYFPTNFVGDMFPINNIETYKSNECVICLENEPNILFCSCGHIGICEKCNKKYNSNTCFICRKHSNILRKI